jgi:NAD(P)-dependent dehydrogenase (short-subunit alcohol dehydrogenase family)
MTKSVREKYNAMISSGLIPLARWGIPEDVAKCVCAIAQDYFPYTTGQIFNIDGGFHLKRL